MQIARSPRSRGFHSMSFSATLGLQRRIMLYVTLGSVAVLFFFGYVAHQALDASARIIFSERLHLAGLVAREAAGLMESAGVGPSLRVPSPQALLSTLVLHATSDSGDGLDFRLTVWDGEGNIIAGTGTPTERSNQEHLSLLQANLAGGRAGVVTHTPVAAPDKAHVVAFAPLPGLPGGVLLEQGQDAALHLPRALQRQLTWLGAVFIVASLFLAWFTTRQVVGPLTRLTAYTRDVATGNLAGPVPQGGQDEVRVLAASFEAMRRQLQESHAQLAEANRELERRVQERTQELLVQHAELARASLLLQHREAERTFLLQKTIQAQEEERRRVARDLHDAVGQLLSALVLRLSVVKGTALQVAPQLEATLGELGALASQCVGEVRRLVVDLRPELLDDMGLPAALGWYAEQMLGKHGISATLDVEAAGRRLPAQVEVAVFRVMQEAITNVLKHARARHVHLALAWEGEDLVGTVSDDGVGFAPGDIRGRSQEGGAGLIGMRERISLLGGHLLIDSRPGSGTRLTFRVPVGKEEVR